MNLSLQDLLDKLFKRNKSNETFEKVNLNDFAKLITAQEGLKESISIAQIKELNKIVFTELAKLDPKQVEDILNRYRTNE